MLFRSLLWIFVKRLIETTRPDANRILKKIVHIPKKLKSESELDRNSSQLDKHTRGRDKSLEIVKVFLFGINCIIWIKMPLDKRFDTQYYLLVIRVKCVVEEFLWSFKVDKRV